MSEEDWPTVASAAEFRRKYAKQYQPKGTSTRTKTRDDLIEAVVRRFGFRQEVPFGGRSGLRRYRFDAACPERKIAVEYNGYHDHSKPKTLTKDYRKMNEAQLCGWIVMQCDRYSAQDGACLEAVRAAIALRKGVNGQEAG